MGKINPRKEKTPKSVTTPNVPIAMVTKIKRNTCFTFSLRFNETALPNENSFISDLSKIQPEIIKISTQNKMIKLSRLANLKCPNQSSAGNGRLKAINKKCHKEKIAPTKRLKVNPTRMSLSILLCLSMKKEKIIPIKIKNGTPAKKRRRSGRS